MRDANRVANPQDPFAWASARYVKSRAVYRMALEATQRIEDPAVRHWVEGALMAKARANCRAISGALTEWVGCRLTALPEGYSGAVEVDHAVPLNLIHDKILGIGEHDRGQPLRNEEVRRFVEMFVVGVKVTPGLHALLKKQHMPICWQWLADHDAPDWDSIKSCDWAFEKRPLWLRSLMGRYEDTASTRPLHYRPSM